MADTNFHAIADGGTLRVLDCGLEIVRREKHEWRAELEKLSRGTLAVRTGKIWGSKFYPHWPRTILVTWIARVVKEEAWELKPGTSMQAERVLDKPAGLVAGDITHRIRVVCDGRYIHAYPVSE